MSLDAISIALTGLKVSQNSLATVSNNLANASTEGYTRKISPSYTPILQGHAYGARSAEVIRNINEFLQKDLWTQTSNASNASTRNSYLSQIQNFYGDPTANASMSSSITALKTAFQNLSSRPEDTLQLNQVYAQAVSTAKKVNDFGALLVQLRNNAQTEMQESINTANSLIQQIATYNQQIQSAYALGVSSADVEDLRDSAVKKLSLEVSITSYKREDGTLQVMTANGDDLVSTKTHDIVFDPIALGAGSYYPTTAKPVYLDSSTGPNLTEETNLGGRLGALIALRDTTLPTYQAQLDELAINMAHRFSAEGLDLYTSPDGTIPANTAGSYVGFANTMQVNTLIKNDKTLLVKGTDSASGVQAGSTEVLRRIVDYAFGEHANEQSVGTVDLRSTAAQTKITGTRNIGALGALDAASTNITAGSADTFSLTVGTTGPTNIVIGATDTAANLVTTINAAFAGLASLNSDGKLVLQSVQDVTIGAGTLGAAGLSDLGLTAGSYTQSLMGYLDLAPQAQIIGTTDANAIGTLSNSSYINPGSQDTFTIQLGSGTAQTITIGATDLATDLVNSINAAFPNIDPIASIGASGQLVLRAAQDITIGGGTLGANGLAELGLTTGATAATNPSFTIASGINTPTTVSITPTDTATTFLAKLNAVTGITASLNTSGQLSITPTYGGDITLIDGQGAPLSALGMVRSYNDHTGFHTSGLGGSGSLSTGISSAKTLAEFATQMVTLQSADASTAASDVSTTETFKNQLQSQLTNESGVNVDEEMAQLITLQTAYNAAANAIRVAQQMMDLLTNLFRN